MDSKHETKTQQPPELGRRDRKKLQTREALATAALELFEEKGFTATSIENITDRADVARRTFFRHFSNKESTLLPHPEQYEQLLSEILDSVTPPITFESLMQTFISAAATHPEDRELQQRRIKIIEENRLHIGLGAWESLLTVRDKITTKLAAATGISAENETLQMIVDLVIFTMTTAQVSVARRDEIRPLEEEFEHMYALITKVVSDKASLGEPTPETIRGLDALEDGKAAESGELSGT